VWKMSGYSLLEELKDALMEANVSHEVESWAMEDGAL
jgi:hypothetical protein